jgi:hypothetical protein
MLLPLLLLRLLPYLTNDAAVGRCDAQVPGELVGKLLCLHCQSIESNLQHCYALSRRSSLLLLLLCE